ncbi:hypothetical protein, partial [Bradyrhizobium sp. LjRoot220]|uniref:hypothetical protein n=1 Tax=Bradyrhizobium sp. LjRoot220 TaxID=3342284 RepID=UPI003F5097AD
LRREGRVFPAALYARVQLSIYKPHTGPRVQRASGLPCALCFQGQGNYWQSSGAMRRENVNTHSAVITRVCG